jgi:hypothetical protein
MLNWQGIKSITLPLNHYQKAWLTPSENSRKEEAKSKLKMVYKLKID